MKKTYILPSTEVIKMETVSIVAASLNLDNETYVDTSTEGGQLGREDRPSHPNLWDQTW
jgi:hypothetical protein